ncbi:MAG: PIN domain-containing protein [Xanthobacteraceae bacterium]
MTDEAPAPIIYVDANPFSYFVDGDEDIARHLKPFFDFLREKPGLAMTSELTLAEVLAKASPDARRGYFIVWSNLFQLHPVTRDILIDTADYRRVSRKARPDGTRATIKLPDAIHVVTAIRCRCRAFPSADADLRVPVEMAVFEPSEAGVANLIRGIV